MDSSEIKSISLQQSDIKNKEYSKTISLNTNTNLDTTTKIISMESPTIHKRNIKSISFLDYETTETNVSSLTNNTLLNNETTKTISLTDNNTDNIPNISELSIIDSDTIKSFSFYNNKKEIVYLDSIVDIIKLKKNTCIRYKHKTNQKIKWAIIHDIVINNNHVTLLLKKGKFSWIHQINLKFYNYFITPY